MAFAMMAIFSLTFTSCGDDKDEPGSFKFDQININGKDYACYGYDMPITYISSWVDDELYITIPFGELSDAMNEEYDYDYMINIECKGGNKPKAGTNLADYPEIDCSIIFNGWEFADYKSGDAIVKSIKDNDHITIEFKNFKCKVSSTESYTLNGTVKLCYDID